MSDNELIYPVVKFFIRRALSIYCREICVSPYQTVSKQGPVLLASTHPDSFLDAIIIGSRFSSPVHFLARGDAFRRPLIRKILRILKLIPIYRLSEGREYLALNDATFERCNEIFSHGGIILIFSEGLCLNQWELRPLKKGTARIAIAAVQSKGVGERLQVYPVSISYNSFQSFGKKVLIRFGVPMERADYLNGEPASVIIHQFNRILSERLQHGIDMNRLGMPEKKPGWLTWTGLVLLGPLALAGFVGNAPLYLLLHRVARKKTAGTVFFDSVLFGLLLLGFPVYYLLLLIAGWLLAGMNFFIFALTLPLTAWCYTRWKDCRLSVFYSAPAN